MRIINHTKAVFSRIVPVTEKRPKCETGNEITRDPLKMSNQSQISYKLTSTNVLKTKKRRRVYDCLIKRQEGDPYRTHFGHYPLNGLSLQENFCDLLPMKKKHDQTHIEPIF